MPMQLPPVESLPAVPPRRVRDRVAPRRRGGAWKVAYADFVTALMALFIVLWLMNASSRVKSSVTGYFRDPRGYTIKLGAGLANSGEGLRVNKNNVGEMRERIELALRQIPDFSSIKNNIQISVTGEGLRIELMENEQGMFFVTGNPRPTPAGERLLGVLAAELAKMRNPVVIEGHTDARPFQISGPRNRYDNWELAADRANTARRLLQTHGLQSEQIVEIRGFADRRLLNAADPNDPRNRRISVVVRLGN